MLTTRRGNLDVLIFKIKFKFLGKGRQATKSFESCMLQLSYGGPIIFLLYYSLHKCNARFDIKHARSYHDGLCDALII